MADVEVKKIVDFDAALIAYFRSEYAPLMKQIDETGDYNKDIEAAIKAGIESFKSDSNLLSSVLVKFGSRINLRKLERAFEY